MKKMKTISLVLLVAVVVFGGIHIVNIQSANASITPNPCRLSNLCSASGNTCITCWCDVYGAWSCECEDPVTLNHFTVAEYDPDCDSPTHPCYPCPN